MTPVFVNGKFTAQPMTGVQRVATQLVQALDDERPAGSWVLLCPPQGRPPVLRHVEVRQIGPAHLPLHLWEQLALPWAARRGHLLSLAGAAPALTLRQTALVHDAAVFDHPEAYTRVFVAWYRWLFRRLARRGAGLLTVSRFSQGRLSAALGLPLQRLTVVHNGADHLAKVMTDETVLDRHELRQRPFLLAVGSANPTKNLDRLLEAFAALPSGPLQLVLVGGRNAQVFAAVGGADPPGVLRTGRLSDAQLVALYRHARALVFPSVYEGFGLPPLEAMACGCPVAVAWAAAMPEMCGDAALYFDPLDTPGLTQALQRLAVDDQLCQRLRAAGLQQARRFSWGRSARELLHNLGSAPVETVN